MATAVAKCVAIVVATDVAIRVAICVATRGKRTDIHFGNQAGNVSGGRSDNDSGNMKAPHQRLMGGFFSSLTAPPEWQRCREKGNPLEYSGGPS